jgi:DNA-binding NarL/FixJ family response regulator
MNRLDNIFRMSPLAARRVVDSLSPTERQIAELYALGVPVREIASRGHRSDRTVESYLVRVKKKFCLESTRGIPRVWFCAQVGEAS